MAPSEVQSRASYVSKLRDQIDEERKKREELNNQVEELKRFNQELSSKLGLSNK